MGVHPVQDTPVPGKVMHGQVMPWAIGLLRFPTRVLSRSKMNLPEFTIFVTNFSFVHKISINKCEATILLPTIFITVVILAKLDLENSDFIF